MKQLDWVMHSPQGIDQLGLLPYFIFEDDPRPAAEQFHAAYTHGGGWSPFGAGKWTIDADGFLKYPGDPRMKPLAHARLRGETIYVYPHAWVAIVQADGSFEVARMD